MTGVSPAFYRGSAPLARLSSRGHRSVRRSSHACRAGLARPSAPVRWCKRFPFSCSWFLGCASSSRANTRPGNKATAACGSPRRDDGIIAKQKVTTAMIYHPPRWCYDKAKLPLLSTCVLTTPVITKTQSHAEKYQVKIEAVNGARLINIVSCELWVDQQCANIMGKGKEMKCL